MRSAAWAAPDGTNAAAPRISERHTARVASRSMRRLLPNGKSHRQVCAWPKPLTIARRSAELRRVPLRASELPLARSPRRPADCRCARGDGHSGEPMTNLAKDGPEWPSSRPAAWAAAARAARERLRRASTAGRPPGREGAMSPAERRAYWRRLDAEIEERQRKAREDRARRRSGF